MSDAARRLRDARRALKACITLMRTASLDAVSVELRDWLVESARWLEAERVPELDMYIAEAEAHVANLRAARARNPRAA